MTTSTHTPSRQLGFSGEDYVAKYLESLGWQIVARNWRCELGELDLCCLDPGPGLPTAVAVEVKTRTGLGFGLPLEAITEEKRRRLNRLASHWASQLDLPHSGLRVDAVGVLKLPGSVPQIQHVRGLR